MSDGMEELKELCVWMVFISHLLLSTVLVLLDIF